MLTITLAAACHRVVR